MTKDGTDRVLILIWLSALFFLFLFLFLLPAYCLLLSAYCFLLSALSSLLSLPNPKPQIHLQRLVSFLLLLAIGNISQEGLKAFGIP